jgi:hypothetical protein
VAGSREEDAWAGGFETVLLVPVPPGFATFESSLVLGDAPAGPAGASAAFHVELDGQPFGKEVLLWLGEAPVPLAVPLGGARLLTLKSRWSSGPAERVVPVWLHPALVRAAQD